MLKQEMLYEVQLWGCVSALLGLPAELNPHVWMSYLTTKVIIPAGWVLVNDKLQKRIKNSLPGVASGRELPFQLHCVE